MSVFATSSNHRVWSRFNFQLRLAHLPRADAGTLVYEVTLDDPTTWTTPWTFVVHMTQQQGHIYEFACHEGNYYMENMLRAHVTEDGPEAESR